MSKFFDDERAARETLGSERTTILDIHAKVVADADAARDAALASAQEKFDSEHLKAVTGHNDERMAEVDAAVEAANIRAGLDRDGNPKDGKEPKKAKKVKPA